MSFNDYWQAQQRRRAVAEAVAALKEGGPDAQTRLYESLRHAVLLLPVAELPEGHAMGDVLMGQNVQVKVAMPKGPNDRLFMPGFTSEETLRLSHPEEDSPYVLLPFQALAKMTLTAGAGGVILDRGGPHSAVVPPAMLQALADGQPPPQPPPATAPAQQAPQSLHLSPPSRIVTYAELERLNGWLRQQPGLAQAYLFGLMYGTNKPMLTIGMGFLHAPGKEAMEQLARQAGELMGQVGVILLDGQLARLLARQAGAIRFDFNPQEGEGAGDALPSAGSPAAGPPGSQA